MTNLTLAPEAPPDPVAAASHPDPYPYYRGLVAGPPLVRHESLGLWVAASAAAVTAALEHPGLRVRPPAEPVPPAIAGTPAGEVFGRLVRMNDGRGHAQPKAVLQRVLARLPPPQVRDRALAVARGVALDGHDARNLSQWAFQVPVSVTADLLGFPPPEQPQVAAWVADFVACLSPASSPAQLGAASDAARALLARFSALVEGTGAAGGSIVSLVRQEAEAAGWDDAQAILANLVGLLSQTYEATAGLVGNSLVALLTHPGLGDEVKGRPGLIEQLASEVARHDPPVHNTRRFAGDDLVLCGQPLRAGEAVLLLLAAANRDPQANERADEFLLLRPHRRTFGFGHGRHACPGQALAQAVAAAAVEVLLDAGCVPDRAAIAWTYRPSANGHLPIFHTTTGAAP